MSTAMVPESAADTRTRAAAALENVEHAFVDQRDGMACLRVAPAALAPALRALRASASFESVTLVTAIDHHPRSPRFEVVHQLRSLAHDARIRLLTRLADDAAPSCATCVDLWPGAAFMERECFDLFGVVFEGHQGLKRLLMPEGYGHHPLRKDFPHQGIEPDRLYRKWDAERRSAWKQGEKA